MLLRTLLATLLTTALVAVAGPAQAARPHTHEHEAGEESGSFEECGMSLVFHATFSDHIMIKEVAGSGGEAYLGSDNYRFEAVWTNPDTGRWLTVSRSGLFKEMSATHLEGTLWEFRAMDVGRLFTMRDSAGKIVLKDRGRIALRGVFDLFGDGQPSGEQLEEELLAANGVFETPGADFCAVITELLG